MTVHYGALAGAVIAIYVAFQLLLHFTQDKREPPSLATTIPFLSPIIGMSRKKTKYYIELRYVESRGIGIVFMVNFCSNNLLRAHF
jgi:hypothetical protein